MMKSSVVLLLKIIKWLVAFVLLVVVLVFLISAFASRSGLALGPEHRIHFENEFVASMEENTDWAAYLEIEQRVFDELENKVISGHQDRIALSRYERGGIANPQRYDRDWNRSYILQADQPRGIAVLVHGLSDSPYSMRATAQVLRDHGYTAIVPRMPGHGHAVGGLRDTEWQDWLAAVNVAMRHAGQLAAPGQPLILSGYSNGGLLSVLYAMQCKKQADLPCPQGLLLLSPALNVTPFARVADWHQLISWMAYFENYQYTSVLPEIDPFKYTSFPKDQGWEIYQMAAHMESELLIASRNGAKVDLPPVLTFQSLVDDTIDIRALLQRLYHRLPANGSELVIYDVNRNDLMVTLFGKQLPDPLVLAEQSKPFDFSLAVVANRNGQTNNIRAMELPAGELEFRNNPLDLAWPRGVYSLSHIAIPFRTDDPVYGSNPVISSGQKVLHMGDISLRGERNILMLPPGFFLRLRENPFMDYQEQKISAWLKDTIEASAN